MKYSIWTCLLAIMLFSGCPAHQGPIRVEIPRSIVSLPSTVVTPGEPVPQDIFTYKIKNGLGHEIDFDVEGNSILNPGGRMVLSFRKTYYGRREVITGTVKNNGKVVGTVSNEIDIPPMKVGFHRVKEEDVWHITEYEELEY